MDGYTCYRFIFSTNGIKIFIKSNTMKDTVQRIILKSSKSK